MTWIVFLSHCRVCASTRIRTATALDQNCVLKAAVFVITSCTVCLNATVQELHSVHGRVMVDNGYEFQHSSSAQIAPFDARFASQTRKRPHLPTQLQSVAASTTARVPSQPGPEKASALAPSSRVIGFLTGLEKLLPSGEISQSSGSFVLLVALALLLGLLPLLCSLPSRSKHRENCLKLFHLSSVSLSLCIRLDVHVYIDNCLFQFLCSCLRVCSLGATSIVSSHQVSVRLFRGCHPATESIIDLVSLHLVVECGIHGS